ncbi:MAG: peroxide stress protein YaaA [Flavobacteriaceae bacterium]
MKMLISPAKSLNYERELTVKTYSEPCFLKEAQKLNALLKTKSPKKLAALMSISTNLATLNWDRNQNFKLPFTPSNAQQAIYTFDGDVYSGLDVYTLPESKIKKMQESVRILSGLYGLLKPLDLIQAYRLEMGTKLKIGSSKNLYDFWKQKITTALNDELEENELVVNLASKEYFSAIDTKVLKGKLISPVFKEYKEGKLKIISFFAKKARGMMVRHLLESEVQNEAALKAFSLGGYQFSEEETQRSSEPVFIR